MTRRTGHDPSDEAALRLLVIGDSTSLMMAQALSEGADGRIAVLWAGANGCPFAPVESTRSSADGPWKEIDCEPYDTKLPPLIDSFDPEVVMLMSGPLEQTEHRFAGSDLGYVAGAPAFMAARDATMASLLAMLAPEVPVFVTDFPQVRVGPYASQDMLDPARLDALNAQVVRWDDEWNQVVTFPYRMTLEAAEEAFGTLRSDGVHPDARQMEQLVRATFVDQLLEQAASARSLLGTSSPVD